MEYEEAQRLERSFEEEEVRAAIFALAGDKAPGPDDFSMAFFQCFWADVKEEIVDFIEEFYSRGKLLKSLGASFLSLVPKRKGELEIKHYRPISLIGSIYKILAKVLAGRIKRVLRNIISNEQGAFGQGRQILDGVLVANECLHSMNRERLPWLICKLDLEKAYESRLGFFGLSPL